MAHALQPDERGDREDHQRPERARPRHGPPGHEQQQQEAQPDAEVDRVIAQRRGAHAPHHRRAPPGAHQPPARHQEEAEDDRAPRRIGEQRRPDHEGGLDRRAGVRGLGERVDRGVTADPSQRQHRDAREDHAAAARHDGAPAVGRQRDRAGHQQHGDDDDDDDERLRGLQRLLRGLDLVGLEHLQLLQVRRQSIGDPGRQTGAGGDLRDEVVEVERHRAAARDVAVEDLEKLAVGGAVRLLPRHLRGGAPEHLRGVAVGDLAQGRGDRRRERLQVGRERLAQLVLDRRTGVDALQDGGRQRFADLLVLEQAIARLHPVLGVEQLALRPHRDDAHRPQERREHEKDDHAGALHGAIVASPG